VALAGTVAAALDLTVARKTNEVGAAAYASYAQGVSALRAGGPRIDDAIHYLEEAARLESASALPHAALADALVSKWQRTRDPAWLRRAEQSLAVAASRDPDAVQVRVASGRLHRESGRREMALAEFKRAIQLDETNVNAWIGLALTYDAGNQKAEAATAFQRAVEIQPDYYLPHQEFGNFYFRLGNHRRAEHHYKLAIAAAPGNPGPYTNLAAVYIELGLFADAEPLLRRALDLEETRAALTNLGVALNYQRRDREALEYHRRALRKEQPTVAVMVNIGDSCRRLAMAADAADAYRAGLQIADADVLKDPSSALPRAYVAYFMARLASPDAAIRELDQALRLASADRGVIRRAVMTFEALGQRKRTLSVLAGAPASLLDELSRHPDLTSVAQDPEFQRMRREAHGNGGTQD
jgi:superkiller protein 3